MNKRGIFFLMLTIIILSIFVISITFFSGYAERKSTQQRVESLSDFVNNIEADLSRQLFIVGARSVFLMENKMATEKSYIGEGNTQKYLDEIFFDGTIDGDGGDEVSSVTEGIKFSDLQDIIDAKARGIGADVQLSNPQINIIQEDPWNLKVVLTTDFFVEDESGLASWNKSLESVSYIAITNFTDPVFLVGPDVEIDRDIVMAESGVTVSSAIVDGSYSNFSGAPSFIDRLEGNLDSESENGIISLVDKTDARVPTYSRPIVDYIYFSNVGGYTPCSVSGVALTSEHAPVYGVAC